MRVSEALAVDAVLVRPRWATFEEAVAGLVEQLVASGAVPNESAALAVQLVHEREAMAGTAMVDVGVSIPHARLDGITPGIVAAMAVSPTQVYEVADGLPISIVALVLSSPALVGEHLTFLSSLSMLLQSARTREQLRNATSAEEVLRLVRNNEGRW